MNKTYHSRVFGGKNADWRGVDQGRGPFYPGALSMAMNATFSEDVFKSRDGQARIQSESLGSVLTGANPGTKVVIGSGTDIFVEDVG